MPLSVCAHMPAARCWMLPPACCLIHTRTTRDCSVGFLFIIYCLSGWSCCRRCSFSSSMFLPLQSVRQLVLPTQFSWTVHGWLVAGHQKWLCFIWLRFLKKELDIHWSVHWSKFITTMRPLEISALFYLIVRMCLFYMDLILTTNFSGCVC